MMRLLYMKYMLGAILSHMNGAFVVASLTPP